MGGPCDNADVADVCGSYRLEQRPGFGFPWADLIGDDGVVASIGRFSAINTFLLRGQRIEVEGERWRMKGLGWYRMVVPVLVDASGSRLAQAAAGPKDYAITCRDSAFSLIPTEKRAGRPRTWQLLSFNEPIADVRRNPYVAEVAEPVPLPALLISFTLATLGCMGEKELVQSMGWTGPVAH